MTEAELKSQAFQQIVRANATIENLSGQMQQAMGVIEQIAALVKAPEKCSPEQLVEAVKKAVEANENRTELVED